MESDSSLPLETVSKVGSDDSMQSDNDMDPPGAQDDPLNEEHDGMLVKAKVKHIE